MTIRGLWLWAGLIVAVAGGVSAQNPDTSGKAAATPPAVKSASGETVATQEVTP